MATLLTVRKVEGRTGFWQEILGSDLYVFSRVSVLECNWKSEAQEKLRNVNLRGSGREAIAKAMNVNKITKAVGYKEK